MSKRYRVGVIGGDGIGPEVTAEAVGILDAVSRGGGFALDFIDYPFGADRFLDTGELITNAEFEEIRDLDAVLLGAIGDPRVEPGKLEFGIVGRLRFDLDLYVNLRPIRMLAPELSPLKAPLDDLDVMVVRENTEDAYRSTARFEQEGTPEETASQEMIYTRGGTERIIRYAFELARSRPRAKLTLVDKANAVRAHDLYRRVFAELGEDYPDVECETLLVDAASMWMVRRPEAFDVIVTTNMFGDILTDLGAAIQGGLGTAAGANLHPGRVSVFEPVHGSAPRYKGTGKANPAGAILAGAMLLDHVGEPDAAERVIRAVGEVVRTLPSAGTESGVSTSEVGKRIKDRL